MIFHQNKKLYKIPVLIKKIPTNGDACPIALFVNLMYFCSR